MKKGKKGTVFISVMVISMLMVFIAVSASKMMLQDRYMIRRLRYSTEAQYLAEAGISNALAVLAQNGFPAIRNPENFPLTTLGGGTYDVTVIEDESEERFLLESEGAFQGITRFVTVEVRDLTPTSLYYLLSSGAETHVLASWNSLSDINGNLHSNEYMWIGAGIGSVVDVDTCGADCCDGSVSVSPGGTLTVYESMSGGRVNIHGSIIEDAPPVTFPNFDYNYYRDLAILGGGADYYAGDVTFDNATLNPTNGIIYVEGMATFIGNCHLYGGIVARQIYVRGNWPVQSGDGLYQHKSGTRNVIISREGSFSLGLFAGLTVEEAVIYAGGQIAITNRATATAEVTGAIVSGTYLNMWALQNSSIVYNHKLLYPDGLILGSGDAPMVLVSWNK